MIPLWPFYVFLGIVDVIVLLMARDMLFATNVSRMTKVVFTVMSTMAILLSIAFIRTIETLNAAITFGS